MVFLAVLRENLLMLERQLANTPRRDVGRLRYRRRMEECEWIRSAIERIEGRAK